MKSEAWRPGKKTFSKSNAQSVNLPYPPPLLRVEILPGIYLVSKLPFLHLYNPNKLSQYDHLNLTVKYHLKMSHGAFMTSMPHEP